MRERTMAATEIARQAVRALFNYKDVLFVYLTRLTNLYRLFWQVCNQIAFAIHFFVNVMTHYQQTN